MLWQYNPEMTRVRLVCGYLISASLIAGALFISRTFLAPRLFFEYLSPVLPSDDGRWSAWLSIITFDLIGGMIVGVSFGVPLGLLIVSRSVSRAFWIGAGAVVLSMMLWMIVFIQGPLAVTPILALSMVLEVLALIGSLCLTTGAMEKLARQASARSRIVYGTLSLLAVLLLYGNMFMASG
ncbi:MAG TPA: hypothetical protein VFB01_07195 [Burkholderiales bacterium]|nr:hypothetical protein [Burkholderiales bacterium]